MNSTNAKFAIAHLLRCALFRAIFLWQIFFLERLASLANVVFAVVHLFRCAFSDTFFFAEV